LHQFLTHSAAIVAVVRAVLHAAHEKGGLLVVCRLPESGGQVQESEKRNQRHAMGEGVEAAGSVIHYVHDRFLI
jgi:hypothetical protein